MDSGIQSSFIPHEADVVIAPDRRYEGPGGLADLFSLLGIVLFVASLALGVGVFLYQQFLTAQAASKLEQLNRAKAAFDPALVQRLIRLDDRMHAADDILSAHIAPSIIFDSLNQATLATVSFTSLEIDAADRKGITATMRGIAKSVNSVALQDDIFSKNGVVTNPIFSGIGREQDGVHFTLKIMINNAALSFEKLITPTQAAQQPAAPQYPGNPGSPFNPDSAPQGTKPPTQ